ncbi:MAG: ABC transporter substrate-binding protein [Treponema sp.]|nr:ABC transporter substrate-binding protein [Treponema sp.]
MKKILFLAVAILVTALSLTGCGKSEPKEKSNGKTKLVIWDYFETDSQKEMMVQLLDNFNKTHPDYEATHVYVPFSDYQKQLTLGIASGELPDLVIMDGCSMASFIKLGLLADISSADIDWSEYISGPMESTMLDGKHYGLPFATNCTALLYNKDIFDAAGVPYPDENTTWAEFKEIAKKLTKNGISGFGNAATNTDEGTFQCLQWLYTAGGSYKDIEGGVEAFEFIQDMIKEGVWTNEAVNWTQSDVNYNFMGGSLAMEQNGPWQVPVLAASAPDLNYGVTVLPKFDENSGQATSILGGENIGIVNKSDLKGGIEFLKYYDQTEVMVETMKLYGSFPPKTEAAKNPFWTDDPIQAAFIKQLETSIPRGPSPSWPSYTVAIQNGFQEVMTLKKTPAQAAKDTQKAVDAIK